MNYCAEQSTLLFRRLSIAPALIAASALAYTKYAYIFIGKMPYFL